MNQNSLLAKLKANRSNGAAGAAAAAPPPAAPAPAPAQQSLPGAAGYVPVAFAKPGQPTAPLGALDAAPRPAPPAPLNKLLDRLRAKGVPVATSIAAAPGQINPPEHQAPPVAPVAAAAAPEAPAAPAAKKSRVKKADVAPAATGTPPGPEVVHNLAGFVAANPGVNPNDLKADEIAAANAKKIGVLYINCGPVGVPVLDAATLIASAQKCIETVHSLADYRFAEFGQGPGLLALTVGGEIDGHAGAIPALRLDTNTPEGSIVANVLIARASLVVR